MNHGFSKAAESLYLESKHKKANQAIREALRAHPEDLSTLLIALKVFVARKKWSRAERIAKELQKTHPNRPESYYFLCDNARKKSDLKLALSIAKEASNDFPNDHQVKLRLNKIRETYEKQGDLSDALKTTLVIQKSFQMISQVDLQNLITSISYLKIYSAIELKEIPFLSLSDKRGFLFGQSILISGSSHRIVASSLGS